MPSMGLLATAMTHLATVMQTEGQAITYTRGAVSLNTARDGTSPLKAMLDAPQEAGGNTDWQTTTFGERDFGIELADLGELSLPARGDKITLTSNGTTYQWTVTPASTGALFDWLDSRRLRIAVHTIFDGEAP